MNAPQTQTTSTKPAAPRAPSRMSLGAITKGKRERPACVVVYGVEGIGKSTFGAAAPSPIFLCAEDGTAQLDVARFPTPETWEEVLDAVLVLSTDNHSYQTLVMDTLDWAEPMLWAYLCRRDGMANIEAYGFGKGYAAALDEWRVFLASLERLRKAKGMNVILIAHSWIKTFKNPEGEDFDRYEMKLHNKAAGLIKEWADAVLFANYETYANKNEKTKRVRGIDTGARLLFTQRRAAYDAKNRYGLPDSLPLSWEEFESSRNAHRPADPAVLVVEIARKAKELGGADEKTALGALERAGNDAEKLAFLNNWLNARIGQKEN